jgi:hypothetical protein
VRGRDFSDREVAGSPKVAVVNESLARRHFPNQNPIGLRFGKERPDQTEEIEIVGLVKDVKLSNLRDESPRTFFLPFRQTDAPPGTATLVVRATADPASLLQPIQRLIDTSGLRFVVQNGTTQQQIVDDSLRQERLLAQLSSVFGTLALLLACIGVFGVISYTATRRMPEFGLRLALGADQTHLSWLMLRETMILVIAGVVIGATVAFAARGVLKTLLYELTPTDPVSMGAATLLVALVAVLAGAIPARRASHVDPLIALRTE